MNKVQLGKKLYYVPKPSRWQRGIGAELPEEYKKFWREWKFEQPMPVHYIPEEGIYVRNEKTDAVKPVQNIPLPIIFPKQFQQTILGGEGIIQGYVKKTRLASKVPCFWYPCLKESVVYSEILDKYMKTTLTNRTVDLIHKHYGLDHYLLTSRACDLMSELAVGLKRLMLIALADKTLYPNDSDKHNEVYDKYKHYLEGYTREEIEWYGLSYKEACKKWIQSKTEKKIVHAPLKIKYRQEVIDSLKVLQENK